MGFLEIILAIASMAAGEAAVSYFAITSAWQAAAVRFAVALAISTASRNLVTRKSFQSEAEGRIITTKEPLAAAKVIYGRVRVGGTIVYMETTSSSNEYLHMVIVLAGHEVHAIDDIYFDDELVPLDGSGNATGTFADLVRIKKALGTDAQTAFSDLVSESDSLWTSNHRLRGRAAIYVRLKYNQDKFPNGVPNITAIVRGKKVYDPRTTTTAYSTNPALIVADYLCNTRYGLGATYATEIDETALTAAANICDQDVTLDAGGTEDRYTANGSFDTTEVPEKVLAELCSAMAGHVTYVGGKWSILAGAYRSPSITLDEDDLRAGFKVQTLVSRRDQFNSVKGVFSSPDNLWQPTDFPSYSSATFVSEDNSETVYRDISLPYTTSAATAQRLAKIELYKAREQLSMTLPCKLTAYGVQVGDVVNVTNTRMGWSAKAFEVVGTKLVFDLDAGFGVDLDLRETNSSIYSWDEATEEQEFVQAPNTNLPNPRSVPAPTALTLTEVKVLLNDGTLANGIRVSWTAPSDYFVKEYEVQYIRTGGAIDYGLISQAATSSQSFGDITASATATLNYGSISDVIISGEPEFNSGTTTTTQLTIAPVIQAVEYTVKVRSVSHLAVRSAFVQDTITTGGDTTAPAAPSLITATGKIRSIVLNWENPSDLDFDSVEVFRNTTNSVNSATKVAQIAADNWTDTNLDSDVTRYYWLRSVDMSGNRSAFSSSVNATTQTIVSADFSAEVLNLFAEAGAYGIEPVASLPASGDFVGQIKFDTTAVALYRWTGSAWDDDIFSITTGSVTASAFAAGIEPISVVSSLPSASGYTGPKVVFLTTDGKLYRYASGAWTTAVLTSDLSGTLASSQFSNSLRPVEVVSSLPSSSNFQGRTVFLTTDNKIYRHDGTNWTAAVPASDLSGTVSDAQIAGLAAAKITGTLTNSQIADVAAAKITGSIVGTQITDGAISTAKLAAGSVTTAKVAAGAISADEIAANAITAVKISSGAVETAKIAAGAIEASKIASSAITTDKLAANAVTTEKITSNAITTGLLAAGAVTSDILASNSIIAGKIAAGAINSSSLFVSGVITSSHIQAGTIQGDRIAANTITGGLIAASGIITSAAQINDAVVTNAKVTSLYSSDYNGPIPPSSSNFGTAGWYLDKSGSFYGNSVYLRGQLVSGTSGAQRVEINKTLANKLAVYNSSNTLIGAIGGSGVFGDAVIQSYPQIVSGSFQGAYIETPSYTGSTNYGYGLYARTADGEVDSYVNYWDSSIGLRAAVAGTISVGAALRSGVHGYRDSSYSAGGRFYDGSAGTLVTLADSSGYALNIRSGQLRYGSTTIQAPSGSSGDFLRGNGSYSALSASDIPNISGNKITSGLVDWGYVAGFKNGSSQVRGIAGTGSTATLQAFLGSETTDTTSGNMVYYTEAGGYFGGVYINQRGTTATWSALYSDARMKDVLGQIPIADPLETLKKIGNPVIWKWNHEASSEVWGYTAQQIGQGLPDAVIEAPRTPRGDYQLVPGTEERVLTFDNTKFQMLKDMALISLIEKIEMLEAKIAALEARS
jgi:hypothetical protein